MIYPIQKLNTPKKSLKALALGITYLALLTACGGGSDSSATGQVVMQHDHSHNGTITGPTLNWSDPDTWGGTVPAAGDNVTIPKGKNVLLNNNIKVGGLTVNGNLVCADKNLNVSARWIMVHGILQCGTENQRFTKKLTITLTGNNKNESVMGMGTKMISAMGGGIISLHGENRTSWLSLAKTANSGTKSITVDYAPNWRAGDEIVIASTDDDMHHAEVRTIASVNGTQVNLTKSLDYRHFGEWQYFGNGNTTWELNTRAEVALLSRNIKIQGNAASDAEGFGGHMMVMEGSAARISGVELYRMGQSGILARYPFHWHMANNVAGQYFTNSSIRKSFSRCVTVHGSHNATVSDNVCYDHIGHGYFLEDGGETGNVFDHNLGLVTRKPSADIALIPSDRLEGAAARGPSTFWISNGDNTFTNNVAAGSDGLGFWYDTKTAVTGVSATVNAYRGVSPRNSAFGKFENNTVHSSDMAFSSCTNAAGPVGYTPPEQATYENLTVYSSGDGAVWPCHGNQVFNNLKVTDTGKLKQAGFVAPRPVTVQNSLFVANSKLNENGRGKQRSAIGIYDFGVTLNNIHFENFNNEYGGSYVFGAMAGDVRHTNNPARRLSFGDSYLLYDRRSQVEDMEPSAWGSLIHDEDGSLGLGPNTALVADHPLMTDSTCTDNYGTGKLCSNRYGRIEMDFNQYALPEMTHSRSDGPSISAAPHPERGHYQSIVSVNHNRYHYIYSFDNSVIASGELTIEMNFLHDGDTVVLEFNSLPSSLAIGGAGYSAASSLAALKQGPGKQFFKTPGAVFVKMKASGNRWYASDSLRLTW